MRLTMWLFFLLFSTQAGAIDQFLNVAKLNLSNGGGTGAECFLNSVGANKLLRTSVMAKRDELGRCEMKINISDFRKPIKFCALSGYYIETIRNDIASDSHGCNLHYGEDGKTILFWSRIDNVSSRLNKAISTNATVYCSFDCYVDSVETQVKQ